MKKFNYLLILCFLTLVTVSCENDEDPSKNLDDLPGALVANIDGQSFDFRYQPRAYEGTYQIGDDIYNSIFLRGTTNIDYTRELNITIINPVVGTFELGSTFLSDIYYTHVPQNGSADNNYGAIDGIITVTQLGDRIKGSFNATLYDFNNDIEIPIDGTFDLVISE